MGNTCTPVTESCQCMAKPKVLTNKKHDLEGKKKESRLQVTKGEGGRDKLGV